MVGDVIDGRVILHESPVFNDEDSYFDLYDFSIVITLNYPRNKFRRLVCFNRPNN